jgi:hypothetical protein
MIKSRNGSTSCKTLRISQRRRKRFYEIEYLPKNLEIRRRKSLDNLTRRSMNSKEDIDSSSKFLMRTHVTVARKTLSIVFNMVRQRDKELPMTPLPCLITIRIS